MNITYFLITLKRHFVLKDCQFTTNLPYQLACHQKIDKEALYQTSLELEPKIPYLIDASPEDLRRDISRLRKKSQPLSIKVEGNQIFQDKATLIPIAYWLIEQTNHKGVSRREANRAPNLCY